MADGSPGWESLFWMLFEKSPNGIILIDEQRRFVDVNAATVELFGYTRGALLGRSITDIIKTAERVESWERWRSFQTSGEYSGLRTLVRTDDTEVTVKFAARLANIGGRKLAVYVAERARPNERAPRAVKQGNHHLVTAREKEVIRLIALGKTTAGIAEELSISPETVRTHVRNTMRKIGVHTRAQLVAGCLTLDAAEPAPPVG